MKNSSLTNGLKLYHQWQLYLCVSVFQQGTLLLNWMVANVWECAALERLCLWQLRILDWNTWMCCSSCLWDFKEPRHGNIQITGQFPKFWSSKTGISNVNVFSGKVVSCCLGGCGSVLCHLNEWLSILLCLCVLRLFVFALWSFFLGKKKKSLAYLMFSVLLVHYTFTRQPWVMKHWSQSLYSSCFF